MSKRKLFRPLVLLLALTTAVLAVASIRKLRGPGATPTKARSGQNRIATPSLNDHSYVRFAQLPAPLRWHLKQFGDRITAPGKERITITGMIKRAGDSRFLPIHLTLEFPDRVRLTVQDGIQQRTIAFNGQTATGVGDALTNSERDIIESLVYDTEEHFLLSQTQGAGTRVLGQRFRADDGTTPNYTGPYYDLYEVTDQVNSGSGPRIQRKTFYFDSTSLLLAKVRYQLLRDGATVDVETQISEWQKREGQQIARRILRLENNQPVLTLTINAVAIGRRIDDESFGQ
jgi:hypothetical protein